MQIALQFYQRFSTLACTRAHLRIKRTILFVLHVCERYRGFLAMRSARYRTMFFYARNHKMCSRYFMIIRRRVIYICVILVLPFFEVQLLLYRDKIWNAVDSIVYILAAIIFVDFLLFKFNNDLYLIASSFLLSYTKRVYEIRITKKCILKNVSYLRAIFIIN